MTTAFPVIDPVATGQNILRLRKSRGFSVRELQDWFGFEEPQAIYKWQKGKSLPTVDNLYALSALLNVPMQDILVPCTPQLNKNNGAVSNESCPPFFLCQIPICRALWNDVVGADIIRPSLPKAMVICVANHAGD